MRLAISSSILLIYGWIWLLQSTFSHRHLQWSLTGKLFALGGVLVGSLFGYSRLLTHYGLDSRTLLQGFSWQSIGLFSAYCVSLTLLLGLFFHRSWRSLLMYILVGLTLFFSIGSLGIEGFSNSMSVFLLFTLISAFAEEYLKYTSGQDLWAKQDAGMVARNMIFYCMLVGFGFAMVENLFYLGKVLITHEPINLLQFLLGRGIVSSMLHMGASGLAGLLSYSLSTQTSTRKILMGITIGLLFSSLLHFLYNRSLLVSWLWIFIPLVIGLFILLSYLLFHADMRWVEKKKN